MTEHNFALTSWWRALTSRERFNSAVFSTEFASTIRPVVSEFKADGEDQARSEGVERWRSQPPFGADQYFSWLMEQKRLTDEEFRYALDLQEDDLTGSPSLPEWVTLIQQAYTESDIEPYEPGEGEEELGFLNLVDPLVERAIFSLRSVVDDLLEQYPKTPINPDTIIDIFVNNLPGLLIQRLGRTLVLELNVMRLQDQLEGENAHERFLDFVRKLRDPEVAAAILNEYPVLAKQLHGCIEQWFNVSAEFLERVCADYSLITELFSPEGDPGALTSVTAGAGDTHRRGRTVMIASFESGLRIVYKPKSLAIDVHFQELLNWLNDAGCEPPLRTFLTVDREEYGWAEFVTRSECSTHEELRRFYRRQGINLALMYVLVANDFHYENVIAAGEYPMLIDLETMLQPSFDRYEANNVDSIAAKGMAESVLTIGLLPMRIWSGADYEGIDISGLGGSGGQLSPDRIPGPADIGTDAMHYVRQRVEIEGDANRPMLDGVEASAIDFLDEIEAGYETLYEIVRTHKDELLQPGRLIDSFAHDAIRILMRPTRTYGQLLYESFHPDMLRDAIDRERFLDRLWLVVPARNHLRAVIESELNDLWHGDIPVFTSTPSSLDINDADDRAIPGVLNEPGLNVVHERINSLSGDDLRRQLWYVRASISTVVDREPEEVHLPYLTHESTASSASLRQEAYRAANYIVDTAVASEDEATWIGLLPQAEQYWGIGSLGIDLYGGLPGITLFLAYAGELSRDERYTDMARKAYTSTQRRADFLADDIRAIGAYEGWAGLLYTFLHLAALWKDDDILYQADRMANRIWGFIEEDNQYGIVSGSAGAIRALLVLNSRHPSETWLRLAELCGQRLIETIQPQAEGAAWQIDRFGPIPLAGYAHGAAGIAAALLQLFGATHNSEYLTTAEQALAYERSHFESSVQNWPDMRTRPHYDRAAHYDDEKHLSAWCHGAAGIGLSRLLSLQHLQDDRMQEEIDTAIARTLEHGFGYSHCLCHGDLGNLDMLLIASKRPEWYNLKTDIQKLTGMVLDSLNRYNWQCGGPAGVELPGLMLGVAGIGYQLLRLAYPERVSSVLALDPPIH